MARRVYYVKIEGEDEDRVQKFPSEAALISYFVRETLSGSEPQKLPAEVFCNKIAPADRGRINSLIAKRQEAANRKSRAKRQTEVQPSIDALKKANAALTREEMQRLGLFLHARHMGLKVTGAGVRQVIQFDEGKKPARSKKAGRK